MRDPVTRVVLDPYLTADVKGREGLKLYTAIEDALGNAVRRSAVMDIRPYFMRVHADMTVRPFIDPKSKRTRWAVVVDNDDDVVMRDFRAQTTAESFYENLVRDVAADDRAVHGTREHVWDLTDVEGVTANGRFNDGR